MVTANIVKAISPPWVEGMRGIGFMAPILLVVLRLAQGLALGGQYGGAAIYVSEHAPQGKRGLYTGWIQTTATLGLLLALVVIGTLRHFMTAEQFAAWGWRVPFLMSFILLGVSVYIRLKLAESPIFAEMKAQGKGSKAPLTDSFARWDKPIERACRASRRAPSPTR